MAENTDLTSIPTRTVADNIFANFEELLTMADRVLERLVPLHIAGDGTENLDAAEETRVPPLRYEHFCTCVPSAAVPVLPLWKPIDEGGVEVRGVDGSKVSIHPQRCSTSDRPVFDIPHAFIVDEESLEAVIGAIAVHNLTVSGIEKSNSSAQPSSETGRNLRVTTDDRSTECHLELRTTISDSVDLTWNPEEEESTNSSEYCTEDVEREIGEVWRRALKVKSSPVVSNETSRTEIHVFKSTRDRFSKQKVQIAIDRRKRGEPKSEENPGNDQVVQLSTALQQSNKKAQLKSTQPKDLTKNTMGKEKETFESWRKPKRGGKVGTRANPSGNPAPSVSKPRGGKEKDNSAKPKGMKTTTVVTPPLTRMSEVKDGYKDRNEQEETSQKCRDSSAHEKEVSRGEKKTRASSGAGQYFEAEAVREGDRISKEHLPMATPDSRKNGKAGRTNGILNDGGKGVQESRSRRLGKERARTPSPNRDWGMQSIQTSDHVVNHDPRSGTRTRLYSAPDSDKYSRGRRPRRRDNSSRHGSQRSVGSGSTYESRSPLRMRRRKRDSYGRRVYWSREEEDIRRDRNTHRNGKHVVSESDESINEETTNYRGYRERYGGSSGSANSMDQVGKKREYTEEEESSGSSAEQRRFGHDIAQLKAKKAKEELHDIETSKRRDSRRRQGEMESERHRRERQGLKGHYISVDHRGIPYGFGVGAWRQELNKLSVSLDPSVTNVRYQPEEDMATLRRRLKENFDYSAPIDRAYIRKLAGKSVTQRRSRILASMKEGDSCPAGLDLDVWRRLDRIRQDPSREYLSQRMKNANAARVHKGRTGPKGEDGIKEDLYRKLGRDADPNEVQYEMRRDKGYAGVSKKRKETQDKPLSLSSDDHDDRVIEEGRQDSWDAHGGEALKRLRSDAVTGSDVYDLSYVRRIEEELQKLRGQMTALNEIAIPEALEDVLPSKLKGEGEQESNVAVPIAPDITGMAAKDVESEEEGENRNVKRSSQKKKARATRK